MWKPKTSSSSQTLHSNLTSDNLTRNYFPDFFLLPLGGVTGLLAPAVGAP